MKSLLDHYHRDRGTGARNLISKARRGDELPGAVGAKGPAQYLVQQADSLGRRVAQAPLACLVAGARWILADAGVLARKTRRVLVGSRHYRAVKVLADSQQTYLGRNGAEIDAVSVGLAMNEIVTTVAAVGFGGTHGDRNHKQTNNQRESRAP